MMLPDEQSAQQIRLECLRLAQLTLDTSDYDYIEKVASGWCDFVLGNDRETDSEKPSETNR